IEVAEIGIKVGLPTTLDAYIIGADGQALDAAFLHQSAPVFFLVSSVAPSLWPRLGLDDTHLLRHFQRAAHHYLILCNHRHGGPADGVNTDIAPFGARLADFHLI